MTTAATAPIDASQLARYAKCIEVSKRINWDIDQDIIRDRRFDFSKKFLPDGLSQVERIDFLSADERRLLSQVQGRTYANMFGLVERFIAAKVLERSYEHRFGEQVAMQALVRFVDEELKHQELFRRIELLVAEGMPDGYRFDTQPNDAPGTVAAHPERTRADSAINPARCSAAQEPGTQAFLRAQILAMYGKGSGNSQAVLPGSNATFPIRATACSAAARALALVPASAIRAYIMPRLAQFSAWWMPASIRAR